MKYAGSTPRLQPEADGAASGWPAEVSRLLDPASQSLASRLVVLAAGLFLIAAVADAPVRLLSQGLDPSIRVTLRVVTEFGNSAWSLGIGLGLLALVELLRRCAAPTPPEVLRACRSALILVVLSVLISGVLASLTKHAIGRIRPSTEANAMVLEFSFLAFKAGWAAFPSGHATTAGSVALALALCFPRLAWAFLALGGLAALSRALLGVHWVSDCLAGLALGIWITILVHRRMTAAGHSLSIPPGALPDLAAGTMHLMRGLAARVLHRLRQILQ